MSGATAERPGASSVERRGKGGRQPQWYWYRTCGLTIRSQLEVPELSAIQPTPDDEDVVDIVLGEVPRTLPGGRQAAPWLQTSDRQCLVGSPNVARYLVDDGCKITVDRRNQASSEACARDGEVRTYLLGTVLGALLHQRQWLPLHVSTIKTSDGAVAFTGSSGAGKSTLVAYLHYRLGFPLASDDLAVLKPADLNPLLYPGPPRLKLWTTALDALGLSKAGLTRDLAREDKFHIHQTADCQNQPEPLSKLVILTRGEPDQPATIRRIRGIEAYRVFMHSIYRPALCRLYFDQARLHDFGGRLVGQIEVYEYRRPWELAAMEANASQLCQALSLALRD